MTGYVLPPEAASSQSLMVFPGFPGRFMPGEPLALGHMGIQEDEADAIIAELGLPLQKVEMSASAAAAPIDRGDGHAPSGVEEEVVVAMAEEPAAEPADEVEGGEG